MSTCLIVWAILNILFGSVICGVPALIYSILYRRGYDEHFNVALYLNIVSTILIVIILIVIILITTAGNVGYFHH